MCEWLSSREWCDVRLLCGGRSFSAHRAVLASASTFLRQLLLSCADESPTFIVLPDFDLEAVSSVLYYVYNGEVTIQKTKLKMFLDIIKEMQIFVDSQYLQAIGILHGKSFKTSENLALENDSKLELVNITKHGMFAVTPQCHLKVGENYVPHLDIAKPSISVNNMQLTHADRQTNSFLRDLFTETYPRNGNVNGCAGSGGVLAISNELYLTPTSVLSKNANSKQLGDETRPGSLGMGLTSPSAVVCHPWKWRQSNENKGCTELQNTNFNFNNKLQMLPNSGCDYSLINDFPELTVKAGVFCTLENSSKNDETEVRNKTALESKERQIARVVVLNKVMESPWCSRMPNNFKPFRRKIQENHHHNIENVNIAKKEVNDTNNNIPTKKLVDTTNNITNSVTAVKPSLEQFSDEVENKCLISNEVFPGTDLLNSHKRVHSGRYSCNQCPKTFSQMRNYKYHMSVHRGTREFAATCSVCGKYFNDRGYLSSHMKIHRNRKEYKCSQCPKSFNQRVAYNMHVRIHTGVKPHACEQCGKAFSRKMLLKQHLRTHSGERPYACAHCDKRFADRSNMTLHLRLHTGVKPFSCPMCPKAFTKKHHLKSHLNFHTGAKPYACPRCQLAFTQSSNMRTHFKKCTAEPKDDVSGVTT